jgi:cysteine desulfurase/selenocysteine lyase
MIDQVSFEKTTYADLPHKFEAGTPNIAGGVGFGAAIDYMHSIGFKTLAAHENDLLLHATEKLKKIDGMCIYGDVPNKVSVISFNVAGIHPYDLGTLLDKMGIAVRTGHHCCQPIMDHYKIPGTVRASFAFYNTHEEVERFIAGVEKAVGMLR